MALIPYQGYDKRDRSLMGPLYDTLVSADGAFVSKNCLMYSCGFSEKETGTLLAHTSFYNELIKTEPRLNKNGFRLLCKSQSFAAEVI